MKTVSKKSYLYAYRNEFLLFALMFLMFNSLIFPPKIVQYLIVPVSSAITYFAGYLLFLEDSKKIRVPFLIFLIILYAGTIYFTLSAMDTDYRKRDDIAYLQILYFSYWVILLWKIVKSIFRSKYVNLDLVFASVSGFIALIIMGATLFSMIDYFHPKSFPGIDLSNPNLFDEYIYFSFITQSSIGFGEITPVTPMAKKAVILMGTLGQFYLIILVGLIVSKFASNQK